MVTYDGHIEGSHRKRDRAIEHPIQSMTLGLGGAALIAALGFWGAKESGILTRATTQPAAAADTERRTSSASPTSSELLAQVAPMATGASETRREPSTSLPADYINADSGFPNQAAVNRELRAGRVWGRDINPEDLVGVRAAVATDQNTIKLIRYDGTSSVYRRGS